MSGTRFGGIAAVLAIAGPLAAHAAGPFEAPPPGESVECEHKVLKADTLAEADRRVAAGAPMAAETLLWKMIRCYESGSVTGKDSQTLYLSAKERLDRIAPKPLLETLQASSRPDPASTLDALPGRLMDIEAGLPSGFKLTKKELVKEGIYAGSQQLIYEKVEPGVGRVVHQAFVRGDHLLAWKFVAPMSRLKTGRASGLTPAQVFRMTVVNVTAQAMGWREEDWTPEKLAKHGIIETADVYYLGMKRSEAPMSMLDLGGARLSCKRTGTNFVLVVEPTSTLKKQRVAAVRGG